MKFEYKTLIITEDGSDEKIEKTLNALGDEGWELVAFTKNLPKQGQFSRSYRFVFKRAK